ncbi:DHA2 family efflux MFS transporter permease subunit [Devosia rhodophyticola]|uniref:DHA2 family efflux MFS transporter permease subunit n=1 Tax=Devosia rhodophyticola TaxID=3026423 RepID=A0ABY7YZA7_9HYPH|nr:DHA2 family efflux MFS transporter permease subunit [Devosia rhodophyticola]WDR06723.1 DHA2 family efflux MFS transporter permease subunit [Devosia rhodophyticola]
MNAPHFHVPQSVEEADPRRWIALVILLMANFMNLIDVTIVNVAIPTMESGLGASDSQIEWVIAGYVLAFALGLLPFGRLGDIIGRKSMFLMGVAGFTIGSALCGLSPSIEWLVAARILQGFAGAVMTPQVMAIVQVTFPPQEKGLAFSLFGLSAGMASVAGPLVGGLLINANLWGLDWRPIFLINIPLGVLAIVAGSILIPKTPRHPTLKNDYVGIGLFSAAILLLIYPLIEGRAYGWPLWIFGMMVLSFIGMVAFYLWQKRRDALGQAQLLPISLLENRNFVLGAFMVMVFFSGMPGLFLVLAIFLQTGFGFSPLESGLTTVPFPIGVLMASLLAGRLGSNFLKQRLAGGATTMVVGMLTLRWVLSGIDQSIDHWWFAVPLFISGVGLGTAVSSLFQTVLAGIPSQDAGSGSGTLQAFQQVGGSFGVALVGQIFFTWLANAEAWGATSKGTAFSNAASNAMLYVIGAFLVVALLVPFLKVTNQPGHRGNKPDEPILVEV